MRSFVFFLCVSCFSFAQSTFENVEMLFAKKQFSKAENIMLNYVKEHPKDLKGIELLGDSYGHQKKWDDAIMNYQKLVNASPKTADYHYKHGGALGMKALSVNKFKAFSMIDDVKASFLKAAELDPKHINARWALVELYMQLPGIVGGSKSMSLKYANELEKLSKVDGYLAKGYVYEYDKEPELAEKYYKLAIKEGGSLTCYEKLSTLYENQKQPQKAIGTIQEAQDKHKRNALHYQLGKVAAEYNVELTKGEQCLHTYIKNYSAEDGVPTAWANYRLAQIYKHRGKKQEALKFIDLAMTELPDIKPFKEEKKAIQSL